MSHRLRTRCLTAAAVLAVAAIAGASTAGADVPLSVMQYGVSVAGTQESTWSLAGGLDIHGSEPPCQAPIEASGHQLQTLSSAKPATLSVSTATSPADALSGIVNVAVATDRTGMDTVHWSAVNAAGGCNRAPRVDDAHSQARCGTFAYHLPLRVTFSPGQLAVAGDHDWADSLPDRFQGQTTDDCPWVQAASAIVTNEFGQKDEPPVIGGGVQPASGPAPDLTKLASGVLTVPIDADTTFTGAGGGTPWAGTMTLHVVLHLTLTLTPLGGEDNSIEPGLGIGGVHLGDSLDTVRRLYPHLAIVRRLGGGSGHALWLVGIRGGMLGGLQAIVGARGGGAKPPGSATVREVETTFATPGHPANTFHTSSGIGAGSTVRAIKAALPGGYGVLWKRAVDGRSFGSWYLKGRGRVVTEFDLGQGGFTGPYGLRHRGYQVRVGCPGTSRVPQYKGRPAAGPC